MPPQKYQASVTEHSLLSPQYHWFTINLDQPTQLDFAAGQFILLDVPGIAAKKAYSIPSSPANKTQLNLLIDVSPQGDGTLYLQSLKPGDKISFMAPAGQFVLSNHPNEKNYSFVATGSGVSAIRSMTLWLLHEQKFTGKINFHWGMRFVEDLFWEEEFRMLENDFPNFHFDLVLSKAPEGWPLCAGHINDCLSKHYTTFTETGFYLCGNPTMIDQISKMISEKGVAPENIHHEGFH